MPAYTPNPSVLVGGVTYTGDTLNGVSITTGRTSVDEQPRAGYCSITLVTFDDNVPAIEIDQTVQVEIENTIGNPVVIFAGLVSDVERTIQSYGSVGFTTTTRITGIGYLAKLNRLLVGSAGYAKEFDGTRVYNILHEVLAEQWQQVPAGLIWSDVDPAATWDTYDPYLGEVDTPGQYELTAYSDGETNAYNLAGLAANSARGIIYEGRDGRINYDDVSHRATEVVNNGYTVIPSNVILASNLSSVERLSDLANDVTVIYKNGQTETDTDTDSLDQYGQLAVFITTQLEKDLDAQAIVNYYLTTRSTPRQSLSSITIPLQLDSMSNTLRDDLIQVFNGMPLEINPPDSIYEGNFRGFVESINWTINQYEVFLTLYLTEYALSVLAENWSQVSPLEAWNTVSGTLDWANAQVVA
jgi:hypothetical protein